MNRRNTALPVIIVLLPALLLSHYSPAAAGDAPEGVKVLVQGSPLYGANGVMFGPDGYLYIACVLGREIAVVDPESGDIIRRLTPAEGVDGPDDLAFGPDGSLYWTEIIQGKVGRMFPNGTVVKEEVAGGANPITFSDDGRLFVALAFLGDAFYEIDPDFVEDPRLIAGGIGMLNAMDFGPDGYLYGPIITQGRIVRIDVDADPLEMTTVADGFEGTPIAVKFDSLGRLHALDQDSGEVFRIDHVTGEKEVICQLPGGLDNLAFDSEDRLFVSHAQDGAIFEVLPGGEFRAVVEGGMVSPFGVAVLPRGDGESAYVADMWCVREFDGATGELLSIKEHAWFQPEAITNPMSIASDGDDLAVTSWFEGRVVVWDPDADQILENYVNPSVPLFAVRFGGELVVSQIATSGVSPAAGGDPLATGVYVPTGMETTDDDLYVCDWAAGVVYRVVTDGAPTMDVIAAGLLFPEDLAWDLDGSLLVTESGAGRVTSIDVETGEKSTVVEGLAFGKPGHPGLPPCSNLAGIDVGSLGHIYVTGENNNVLYRIGATERIARLIEDLPDQSFSKPNGAERTKASLRGRLNVVQRLIDRGNYRGAERLLEILVRRRMDGSMTPQTSDDANDLVTDPEAQQRATGLIDALLSCLQSQ